MIRHEVIVELTRTVAGLDRYRPARVPFQAVEGYEYFPVRLTWEIFKIGASDYDTEADEALCPCGATVAVPDERAYAFLGDFVKACNDHIGEAHPETIR